MTKRYFERDWERERDRRREHEQDEAARRTRFDQQRYNMRDYDAQNEPWREEGKAEWDRIRQRDHERIEADRPWRWQNQGVQADLGTFGGTNYGGVVGTSAYGGGAEQYSITNPEANKWLTKKRGQHAGVGPSGYKRSDSRIIEDVCERLTDDPDIDARDIEVDVTDGVVTLTGAVPDRETKYLAEEVAERVSGVKDVNNQVRVLRRSPRRSGDEAA